jgi:chromosome segregation ATPase
LAEAFCARKEHAALTAELSEERSRRVKVMGEMEMELAEEKAKREAAESGFQKVLRFLWECRTIKDLRKELAGFGKSEVEKRADSLARELAAAQEELESIQPDTDEHRTIADSIAGHRKWASATEKCERMCLEKAEKAESELAASRANHIDANTRNMDANDRADSLARELAAKNERLEYLEGQDRSLLEQHQASLITLEDSDLLAVGGRLLDRAEKAEAALSEERSRRVKVMGEGGEDMKNEDGGYAFPGPSVQINDCVFEQHGLTLRDYFAAKVIQGMASVNDGRCPNQEDKKDIDAWRVKCMMQDAQAAYLQADAMIRTREMRPAASPDRGEGEKS